MFFFMNNKIQTNLKVEIYSSPMSTIKNIISISSFIIVKNDMYIEFLHKLKKSL